MAHEINFSDPATVILRLPDGREQELRVTEVEIQHDEPMAINYGFDKIHYMPTGYPPQYTIRCYPVGDFVVENLHVNAGVDPPAREETVLEWLNRKVNGVIEGGAE